MGTYSHGAYSAGRYTVGAPVTLSRDVTTAAALAAPAQASVTTTAATRAPAAASVGSTAALGRTVLADVTTALALMLSGLRSVSSAAALQGPAGSLDVTTAAAVTSSAVAADVTSQAATAVAVSRTVTTAAALAAAPSRAVTTQAAAQAPATATVATALAVSVTLLDPGTYGYGLYGAGLYGGAEHGPPLVGHATARLANNRTRVAGTDRRQVVRLPAVGRTVVRTGQRGTARAVRVGSTWTVVVRQTQEGPMLVDWWLAAGEVQTVIWTLCDANGPVDIHTWVGATLTVANAPNFTGAIVSARAGTILDDGTVGLRGQVRFSTLAADTAGKPGHYWARITATRSDGTPEMFPNAPVAGANPAGAYVQVLITPT